jgi:hypothetical protein
MMRLWPSLVCLAVIFLAPSLYSEEKAANLTSYQKAIRGLSEEKIHAGLPSEKLLDLCFPNLRRTVGGFTEYTYECLPGYHELTIIAKNGRLKRAIVWSCTYTSTYFDEMTLQDLKEYHKACNDNEHVPSERITEHGGWERPRMRDW